MKKLRKKWKEWKKSPITKGGYLKFCLILYVVYLIGYFAYMIGMGWLKISAKVEWFPNLFKKNSSKILEEN